MLSGLKNLALPLAALAAGVAFAMPDAQAQWGLPSFSQSRPQPQQAAPQGPPPQNVSRGENFSARPAAQVFASDCTGSGCHKGPQGLSKDRSQGSLAGFLREHYTNSRESAAAIAAYLVSIPGETRAGRPERQPRASARSDDAARPAEDVPRARRAPPADAGDAPKPTAKPQRERGRQATAAPAPAPAAAAEPPAPPPEPPKPAKPQWDIFD
jgi:hypothetical protein